MRIGICGTCFQVTDLQSVCNLLSYGTIITGCVCSKYLLGDLRKIAFDTKNALLIVH